MAELIQKQDTLNEGREKINAAITDAEQAKITSEDADVKATQALAKSESTQTQLDTIVINGDSSVEAAQARVDEKGVGHTTLKDRIDDGFTKVTSQLNETIRDLDFYTNLRTFDKFGKIDLTYFENEGFQHDVDFDIWRNVDGSYEHNYKIDKTGYTPIFVARNGSAGNDGLTEDNPISRLDFAIKKIEESQSISKAIIKIKGNPTRQTVSHPFELGTTITKEIIIESDSLITSNQLVTWQTHSGKVKKASIEYEVVEVVKSKEIDIDGFPLKFKKVNSLSEVESNDDSYYYNDGVVYVNGNDVNTDDTSVIVGDTIWQFKIGVTGILILNDLKIINRSNSTPVQVESNGGGKLIVKNLKIDSKYGRVNSTANGIATNALDSVIVLDTIIKGSARDNFNYHNTRNNHICKVTEVNCYGENAGIEGVTANNNISTAHEAIHILRVGTKGRSGRGPLIADVNGCYSLLFGCTVFDTGLTNNVNVNSAFYFDDSPTPNFPNPDGKAWLIDCGGGGVSEKGINGDARFKDGKIFVDNFKGKNIPGDVDLIFFDYY